MNKCPTCLIGDLKQSGSHIYCNSCTYRRFEITHDYLDTACLLLAVLISNTHFKDEAALVSTVYSYIGRHVPHMQQWFDSIVSGSPETLATIVDRVRASAVNVVIGEQPVGTQEEPSTDLVCSCGCKTFIMHEVGKLFCERCVSPYLVNQDDGKYYPVFKCGECGSSSCIHVDSNVHECSECLTTYVFDKVNFKFRMVTS